MREVIDSITLHAFKMSPVRSPEDALVSMSLDYTVWYREQRGRHLCAVVHWFPPPVGLHQPVRVAQFPVIVPPYPNMARVDGPVEPHDTRGDRGLGWSVTAVNQGNRVRLGAPRLRLMRPLWPGKHQLTVRLCDYGGEVPWPDDSPWKVAQFDEQYIRPLTVFVKDERAQQQGGTAALMQAVGATFAQSQDLPDPAHIEPQHLLRMGNTNLALLDLTDNRPLIPLGDRLLAYTTRHTGFPIADLQQTLNYPLSVSGPDNMRAAWRELLPYLLGDTDGLDVGDKIWSPIYHPDMINDATVQNEVARASEASKRLGEQGEGLGSAVQPGDPPEDVDLALTEAIKFALDGLRWDPNNFHAAAVAARFAAQRSDLALAYDLLTTMYLRLRLAQRFLVSDKPSLPKTIVTLAVEQYRRPTTYQFFEDTAKALGIEADLDFNAVSFLRR